MKVVLKDCNVIILLIAFLFIGDLNSQQYTFFQEAASFSSGTVNANLGFNTIGVRADGFSANVDRQISIGLDYGVSDNFDVKLDYQRGFRSDLNAIALAPKYTVGQLGISPAIGLLFAGGSNSVFVNPAIIYDFFDNETIGISGGVNYLANVELFGDGLFGFYSLLSYDLDAVTLSSVFYLGPQRIGGVQSWTTNFGIEIGYILGGESSGSGTTRNKGSRKSIWDN